ncbi:dephospho-CoA kinase [Synechococcus sp. ATX 2A4]|uniref:dephospho-CoA kinase n=1 Tax=Synechococcus sp. ATX 2A4 TaxID=2823727 RepID=UPI0020CB961F|nr:dephospho-CoA kinase [Synechococcus sp. ATX 2A4]MCP9884687.1 dephospho-CoA kinase [Synechococcus sp. ATX 2A4]
MLHNQRRIGLTGGIATGKSTVARLLEENFGLAVLDADRYAKDALAPGTAATQAVIRRYGQNVLMACVAPSTSGATPNNANVIDRQALGQLVFADPVERRWLEHLVHPLVRQRFEQELAALAEAPAVVLMIPLLFEAGFEPLCSEIWLVDCDAAEQQARLMARDGRSAAESRARIEAQWPLERKRALADVVIDNRNGAEGLAAQLARAVSGLKAS